MLGAVFGNIGPCDGAVRADLLLIADSNSAVCWLQYLAIFGPLSCEGRKADVLLSADGNSAVCWWQYLAILVPVTGL